MGVDGAEPKWSDLKMNAKGGKPVDSLLKKFTIDKEQRNGDRAVTGKGILEVFLG